MTPWAGLILLVTYLVLALCPRIAKRAGAYRLGVFAVFLLLFGQLLLTLPDLQGDRGQVMRCWVATGQAAAIVVAFLCAVAACDVPPALPAPPAEEPAAAAEGPAGEGKEPEQAPGDEADREADGPTVEDAQTPPDAE